MGQALPGSFTKSSSNPIISNGAGGTWRSGWVDGVNVFRDTRIDRFVVTVGGWDGSEYSTGIFYFDDPAAVFAGTETPDEEATNPVFSPSGGITNVVAWTTIQLPDETYRAYWQNYTGLGSDTVHMASSTDLTTWTHENGGDPVIEPTPGEWDESAAFDPFPVLLEDGTTRVIHAGQDSFNTRGIGWKLLDTDGITIIDDGFYFYPAFGVGDVSPAFGAPAQLGEEPRFGIFHDHRYTVFGTGRSIDRRWTTDGSTFTRESDVLTPDGSGFDSIQVFDPAPFWWEGYLYLVFCGGDTAGDATGINAKVGIARMAWP